jgi:hypothetical protein
LPLGPVTSIPATRKKITVVWRIRAIFGGRRTHVWGNMERKGVTNLDGALRQT